MTSETRQPCQASAPGKVILFGEHSVVHGRMALAASIDLRTNARSILLPDSEDFASIDIPSQKVNCKFPISVIHGTLKANIPSLREGAAMASPVFITCPASVQISFHSMASNQLSPEILPSMAAGIGAFFFLYGCILGPKPVHVTIDTDLPIGAGLGSSAAFCVAVSACLLATAGSIPTNPNSLEAGSLSLDKEDLSLINGWAFEGERIIHGSPSGVDNNVSCYGKIITFKQGNMERIQNSIPLKVLLTNTLVPRNTKQLVSNVKERWSRQREAMDCVFDAMENLAKKAVEILTTIELVHAENGEEKMECGMDLDELSVLEALEEMVDISQSLLQSIGVSHSSIARICQLTEKEGFHSKLTGAGGGGCVLTLLPNDIPDERVRHLISLLECEGFVCYEATVGGPGVEVELKQ